MYETVRNKEGKIILAGMDLGGLRNVASSLGLPAFTGGQLAKWLYAKRCGDFAQMTDISAKGRQLLQENCVTGLEQAVKVSVSADGTKKYLFSTRSGYVESVYIPDGDRSTLCISSQAGCKMGCKFCATGRIGFNGNLGADEIVNQVLSVKESSQLTNIVYMGMGEPLDNYDAVMQSMEILQASYGLGMSYKRITLSTVGVTPALKLFLDNSRCHLALSVHAADSHKRAEIVPAEKAWPVKDNIELIKQYDWSGQRRFSVEYTLIDAVNDDRASALSLAAMFKGIDCRVNLIPYHKAEGFTFNSAKGAKIEAFKQTLEQEGITTTVRRSRGQDIDAACGMLSAKEHNQII